MGGGGGLQAVSLARFGHDVTVVDIDLAMLERAKELLDTESDAVRSRVHLFHGPGEAAESLVSGKFDAVISDSVLMYLESPDAFIETMATLALPGGLISVVSVNPDAWAMRSGLQGRWREVIDNISQKKFPTDIYVKSNRHSRSTVEALFTRNNIQLNEWLGVGIFTDHLIDPVTATDPNEVLEAEWLAGKVSPYKEIARCYHLLGVKGK